MIAQPSNRVQGEVSSCDPSADPPIDPLIAPLHSPEAKDHINKENYFLARRIFDIMEGQSALSEQINDTSHLDNHPGTMNFKQRLREAQRIHERNMILASRLDTIQPYYRNADLSVVQYRGKTPQRRETDKTKFMKEMEITLQMANRLPLTEEESENVVGGMGYYKDFKFTDFYRDKIRNQRGGRDEQTSSSKPRNLLLEYTKSQNNRMLDIAVVKEPFKDRYIIFGEQPPPPPRRHCVLTLCQAWTWTMGSAMSCA